MPDTDIERVMRKWLLEEASGNGPAVETTAGPQSVQRWPLGRGTDKAYWEDTDDCD